MKTIYQINKFRYLSTVTFFLFLFLNTALNGQSRNDTTINCQNIVDSVARFNCLHNAAIARGETRRNEILAQVDSTNTRGTDSPSRSSTYLGWLTIDNYWSAPPPISFTVPANGTATIYIDFEQNPYHEYFIVNINKLGTGSVYYKTTKSGLDHCLCFMGYYQCMDYVTLGPGNYTMSLNHSADTGYGNYGYYYWGSLSVYFDILPGETLTDPIIAGTFSNSFSYSNSQNTNNFTNKYIGQPSNDVFYQFTLNKPMEVTMNHCGSGITDSYMHLLNASGSLIVSNDNYSGVGACSNTNHSYIKRELEAGTYYVVSEGKNNYNGVIQTTITGCFTDEFGYTESPDIFSSEPEAVGGIGGIFDVSPTGAATYTIPIETPQGVGGMTPQIAITYNSQAGNGIAGWGCNIAGVSAITRAPKTIYHDGKAKGIKYGLVDAFLLDGQRLIHDEAYNNISEGDEGAVYHPENDPLTKVTIGGTYSINMSTSPPTVNDNRWFKVERNGMTNYYGRTNDAGTIDSRQKYTKSTPIYKSNLTNAWYLGYVEDVHGNYMVFNYVDKGDTGARYLNSITYGKNTGASNSMQNTITFNYTGSRQDPITYVMDGVTVNMTHRLSGITAKTNNVTYRAYTMTYNTTSDGSGIKYSRLISATVENGNGEALKPITLNWNYLPAFSQSNYTTSILPSSITSDYEFYTGDLNGDGLTDIACIRDYSSSYKCIEPYYASVTNGVVSYTKGTTRMFDNDGYFKDWITASLNLSFPDFYGTGIPRLIVPKYVNIKIGSSTIRQFQIHDCTDSPLIGAFAYNFIASPDIPLFIFSDVNNDGRDEVVVLEKNKYNNLYYGAVKKVNDDHSVNSDQFSFTISNKPEKMFIADFNGNGMNDLMVFYSNGYTIFWNTGNATMPFSDDLSDKKSGTNITDVWMMRMGDFNGDGLPDFIMNAIDDYNWYFALNNGDGTFTKTLACSPLNVYKHGFMTDKDGVTDKDTNRFQCHVYDFDNDGKSDVVITKAMYVKKQDALFGIPIGKPWGEFNQTVTYWLRSTGTSLTQVKYAVSNKESDAENRFHVAGDFNGDGQIELMHYGYNNIYNGSTSNTQQWHLYRNPNYDVSKGKIASVTSGYGATTNITYASFANDGFYTKKTDAVYPMADCRPPIHAVKKVVAGNGVAGSTTVNYSYSGAKLHLTGKGFLGLSSFKAENTTAGITTESGVNGWNTPFYAPSKTFSKTTVTAENKTAETITEIKVVDKSVNNYKNYFAYPHKITHWDMDAVNKNDTTYITSYTYNETDCYMTNEKTRFGRSNMYQTKQYANYTLIGRAHRPQLITVIQKHADDANPFTQITKLQYNGKGLPEKKIENFGSSKPLTTNYEYDAFGNLTSVTISGADVPATTAKTEYDATMRFPERQYTVPASVESAFVYDTWGNVTKEKDETYMGSPADTVNTNHKYDAWGRRTLTTLPDGRKIRYYTGWNTGNTAKRYFTLVQGDGMPWTKTWYDAVGHETETETIGAKDISIKTTHTYYTANVTNKIRAGKLYQTVSKQGNVSITETFDYDARGRLETQLSSSSGITTTYGYPVSNGIKSQTVSANSRTYTKTFDAWGNIKTSTTAPISTFVEYQYHSSGQPKTINSDGVIFEMEYYDTGKQKKLIDPNAGTSVYTYDAAGRLETQTDGRGVLTEMYYDNLGRVSVMVQGGDSTTYTYGKLNDNNLHRLEKIQTGNNYVSYIYNKYGQPLSEQRYIDGVSLDFTYLYNAKSQLQKTNYPGSVPVTNEYDAYGNLVKILANAQPVWELTGNTGTVTTTSLGGSMTATRTYNSTSGNLTKLKTVKSAATIRDMDYVFNTQTGNLTSRTGMLSEKETFGYDDLDRLKTVHLGNFAQADMTLNYDSNGNILDKTGLGEYGYHSTQKHAVEYIENVAGLINSRRQSIEYNAFNKATVLIDTVGVIPCRLDITYGPDQQRWKTVLKKNNAISKTILFAGDYERVTEDGVTKDLIYLPGGGIYVKQAGQADKIYYTHKDHLGSIISITDGNGSAVFKASYDAWGQQIVTTNTFKFHRGYTGHEHLPEFGLINMNGRMYDPIVGRFLSPDPYVQMPDFSQSFNRYSYCLNNPLIYTDPSGELIGELIYIGFMIYYGGMQSNFMHCANNGTNPFNPGNWNWKSPMTYVSMAASGLGAYYQIGGLNGFSNSAAAATAPVAASTPTSVLNPEFADALGTVDLSWSGSLDKYNLSAGPGGRFKSWVWEYPRPNQISAQTINGWRPLHKTAIAQSIYAGQRAFWSSPATQFVLSVIPIMPAFGAAFKGISTGARALSTTSKVAKPIVQATEQGFNSFSAFKRAMGPAGPGQAWHHIVEQTPGNIVKFGNQSIQNTSNLLRLNHGAGSIHMKVSGYYSSIRPFTNGQTVRQWLSPQSFQAQYDFGIQTLEQFGWIW